jgi:zinc protease
MMTEGCPVMFTFAARLARVLIPLALGAAPCLAATDTFEHKLDNGLRVIVKPDRRAPVAVSVLWSKVGSVDEVNGVTGVAHVLEHMMFKGTATVKVGEYARIVSATGSEFNAYTSRDYTSYVLEMNKSQLPLAFKLEADRMTNVVFSSEEFAKEIKVVMEERRWRTDDRPRALVYDQLMATALLAHPYRHPSIGWRSDLENMRVEDVSDFYQRWYAPNNAILVVVGDVDPPAVFALAETHFGAIKSRPIPQRKPQDEPQQRGLRRATVKAPAELPYFLMTYRVPTLRDPERDWEPYALEMLAEVLAGHEGARLTRNLVRVRKIATSVSAYYDGTGRGPGMFFFSATALQGKTANAVEQALRDELRKIVEEGVLEDELQGIKAQAVAAHVYQRDSMFYQARLIGYMEIAGISHNTMDLQLEKLRQVTPEQVREVARKYFNDDTLTIVNLDPQPLEGRKPQAPPAGLRHVE